MAYQAQQFQILTPDQANAFWPSFNKGAQTGSGLVKLPQELQQMKLQNALDEYKRQQAQEESKYYPDMALANLQQAQALPKETMARTGLYGAQTNELNLMTPEKLKELQLKNKFYPEQIQAEIANNKALADWRKSGGFGNSGLGVGGKEELLFQNFVQKDNPQLKPEQVYEASNVLRSGGDTLSDGTKLNPLSPASRSSYDRLIKSSTTSGSMTPLILSNQASKEMEVLSKYAQEGLKPYGTTYFNKSPQQIMDSFKSDDESQERLGNFIASQQLLYDIAQNSIKVAQGQPGVTSTQELMQLGQQAIDAKYPRLSAKARAASNKRYILALNEGLKARKEAGVSISNALDSSKNEGTKEKPIKLVIKNGKLVRE